MKRRALLHSGGNARGAVGVPVLEHLSATVGVENYHAMAGVSVGMANVPEFAAGNLPNLRSMYYEVDGLSWYLRTRPPWMWSSGVTSIDRLRTKIAERGAPKSALPPIPIYAGVYDYEWDRYLSIDAHQCNAEQWLDARVASMAIPIVMQGWDLPVGPMGERHRCYDGGMRHVIPDLPEWWTFDVIDVILCSPLLRNDKRSRSKVDGFFDVVERSIDVWTDSVVLADIARLHLWARTGIQVNLYAPRDSGGSFDASQATMQARLVEGEWMAANPMRLK